MNSRLTGIFFNKAKIKTGSGWSLKPRFGAGIFNFHGEFWQKLRNYYVITLELSQTNPFSGNLAPDHGFN